MDLVIQGKSNRPIIGIVNDQKNVAVQRFKDTVFNWLHIKKAHHNKWACLVLFGMSDFENIPVIVQIPYGFLFDEFIIVQSVL